MTQNRSNRFKETLKRYTDILSEREIQTLLYSLNNPPTIGIRMNPLKGPPWRVSINYAIYISGKFHPSFFVTIVGH